MFTLTRPHPGAPLSKCEYTSGHWTIDFSLKRPEGKLWRIKYQGVVMDYAPTLARAQERTTSLLAPDFIAWVERLSDGQPYCTLCKQNIPLDDCTEVKAGELTHESEYGYLHYI